MPPNSCFGISIRPAGYVTASNTSYLFAGQCHPYHTVTQLLHSCLVPSVLWRCWLGGRKGIRPVKNRVVGCWHSCLSGARCRLAYGTADATATHCLLLQWNPDWFYLSGTGLTRVVPDKGPLNRCVYMCVTFDLGILFLGLFWSYVGWPYLMVKFRGQGYRSKFTVTGGKNLLKWSVLRRMMTFCYSVIFLLQYQ